MKNVHDVIRRPVLTEQSYEGFADKKYVFEVAIEANRTEIKKAVEDKIAEFTATPDTLSNWSAVDYSTL